MANPRVRRTRKHQRHRERVMRAHDGVCHICGENAADAIDHIVPVSWGGSDDPSNLAPAHTSCNTARGAARPPEWTYTRPSMWLPGYGPRAPGAMVGGRRAGGCAATLAAVVVGIVAGGVVALAGGPSFVVLLVTFAVGFGLFWWLRSARSSSSPRIPGASLPVGRPDVKQENGSSFRDARGEMSLGGRGADVAPEGDDMVTLDFDIEGSNAATLINEVLELRRGQSGYRDGICGRDSADLVVYAMVRLAADAAATGDDDVEAAPVGRIREGAWSGFPGLGLAMTLVQVGLGVDDDGTHRGWIRFRRSVGVAHVNPQ